MTDWRSLGTAHRRRDEAAAALALARSHLDTEGSMTSLARWSGIVRAIRGIVGAYNGGVGYELLVVTETTDRQHPRVVIECPGSLIPALDIRVDAAELHVSSCSTDAGSGRINRWVDLTRADDDTAAYLLQEWMERL
jgi:hypothetical protein